MNDQTRISVPDQPENDSFLATSKPPQLQVQETPNSFETIIEQLTERSFHLCPAQMSPSPPESVFDESDLELEIDRAHQNLFDHKTDQRVHDYHSKLRKRYNGMMNYLQKQTTTYWK